MKSNVILRENTASYADSVTPLGEAQRALNEAVQAGTAPMGLPAALLRERETLKLYFYEPREVDHQPAHDQDEIYIVVSGSGCFAIGDNEDDMKRFSFGPGDAIFTPAGVVHRFEDFSDDFGTWVIMYGRPGRGGFNPASDLTGFARGFTSYLMTVHPGNGSLRCGFVRRHPWRDPRQAVIEIATTRSVSISFSSACRISSADGPPAAG